MGKIRTNITIDSEVHDAAKTLNINISSTANRALAEEVRRHLMVKALMEDTNSALHSALANAALSTEE